MLIPKVIKIDFNKPETGMVHRIRAVQGDFYSRSIQAELVVDDVPWIPPDGIVCAVRYCKPDGSVGSYDTLPSGEKAWSISSNILLMKLAPQMFTAPGCVNGQVMFVKRENILNSFDFQLEIVRDPSRSAYDSEDYFNWHHWMELRMAEMLEQAIESNAFVGPTPNLTIGTVSTLPAGSNATASLRGTNTDPILDLGLPLSPTIVDTTLSLENIPADAAATGAALAGKAPTGFGLGQINFIADDVDLDTVKQNGWYCYSHNNTSASLPFDAGELLVIQRSAEHFTQIAFKTLDNVTTIRIRKCIGNVFSPWEWVNPPLEQNVEYRTIQRLNGKPVYQKRLYTGAFPEAGTSKSVSACDSSEIGIIISATGYTDDGRVFPTSSFSGTSGIISISSNQNWINIYCSGNWTGWQNTYVIVEYTKKGD